MDRLFTHTQFSSADASSPTACRFFGTAICVDCALAYAGYVYKWTNEFILRYHERGLNPQTVLRVFHWNALIARRWITLYDGTGMLRFCIVPGEYDVRRFIQRVGAACSADKSTNDVTSAAVSFSSWHFLHQHQRLVYHQLTQ